MQIQMLLIIMLIAALVLTFYSQIKVNTTFKKFSKVGSMRKNTGADVARHMLYMNDLQHVKVEHIKGKLSDHYDPTHKVVRLSDDVYSSTSVAAISVAAHEVGHAIQDKEGYKFLKFRHGLFPLVNFTSKFVFILILAGFFFKSTGMIDLGIAFFSATVLFQLITLPVEFNASNRAKKLMLEYSLIADSELIKVRKVLSAAALTYVASTIYSVIELLRLISMRN